MIKKVGVIGSGQMGNGIAHVAALAGLDVVINDLSAERLKSGMATINGNLAPGSKKDHYRGCAQGGIGPDRLRRDDGWSRRLRPGDRKRR